MQKLTDLGTYRPKRGRTEWRMYRNAEGFIELYRSGKTEIIHGERECEDLERIVTKATDESELDQYFTKRKRPSKYTPDHPGQMKIQ